MRLRTIQDSSRLFAASLACGLALVVAAGPVATAAGSSTKPYFKVYGGSVFVGGGFKSAINGDCSADYQYSTAGSGSTAGGIFTWAKSASGLGGSSSNYDTYALGPVDGDSGSNYGFYSDSIAAPTNKNQLTFANTAANAWGGYFDGSSPQSDCIPDYYDLNVTNATASPGYKLSTGSAATGIYNVGKPGSDPYDLMDGNVQIRKGVNVTVIVDGSVYIDRPIIYQDSGMNDVPKFALVVRGNIYIGPDVSELDGLYIAQPSSPGGSDGILWTCHDDNTDAQPSSIWIAQKCGNKLTINGAVAARQINFMRVGGDVAKAAATPGESAGSGNIAEVINYTPAMIIGGGFFNYQPSSTYSIDSLISLPPVF